MSINYWSVNEENSISGTWIRRQKKLPSELPRPKGKLHTRLQWRSHVESREPWKTFDTSSKVSGQHYSFATTEGALFLHPFLNLHLKTPSKKRRRRSCDWISPSTLPHLKFYATLFLWGMVMKKIISFTISVPLNAKTSEPYHFKEIIKNRVQKKWQAECPLACHRFLSLKTEKQKVCICPWLYI